MQVYSGLNFGLAKLIEDMGVKESMQESGNVVMEFAPTKEVNTGYSRTDPLGA